MCGLDLKLICNNNGDNTTREIKDLFLLNGLV